LREYHSIVLPGHRPRLVPRAGWGGGKTSREFFEPSTWRARTTRNGNQILHGDQTRFEANFLHGRPRHCWRAILRCPHIVIAERIKRYGGDSNDYLIKFA